MDHEYDTVQGKLLRCNTLCERMDNLTYSSCRICELYCIDMRNQFREQLKALQLFNEKKIMENAGDR